MNRRKKAMFVENKLFATLDTVRSSHQEPAFLLSDTVGFIRKLPTMLVDSFKSTLDEVRADLRKSIFPHTQSSRIILHQSINVG
jgi:50S ribosomal subunit-associated GTPase HflX